MTFIDLLLLIGSLVVVAFAVLLRRDLKAVKPAEPACCGACEYDDGPVLAAIAALDAKVSTPAPVVKVVKVLPEPVKAPQIDPPAPVHGVGVQRGTATEFPVRLHAGRPARFATPKSGTGVLRYTGTVDEQGRHVYDLKHGD